MNYYELLFCQISNMAEDNSLFEGVKEVDEFSTSAESGSERQARLSPTSYGVL